MSSTSHCVAYGQSEERSIHLCIQRTLAIASIWHSNDADSFATSQNHNLRFVPAFVIISGLIFNPNSWNNSLNARVDAFNAGDDEMNVSSLRCRIARTECLESRLLLSAVGLSPQFSPYENNLSEISGAAVGDFDADGDDDIVLVSAGRPVWLESIGPAKFERHVLEANETCLGLQNDGARYPPEIRVVDLNSDSVDDVILSRCSDHWFAGQAGLGLPRVPQQLRVGFVHRDWVDIDADGHSDLHGNDAIFFNDIVEQGRFHELKTKIHRNAFANIVGDEALEIATSPIRQLTDERTFEPVQDIQLPDIARSPSRAFHDIDGDGDDDLVLEWKRWYENTQDDQWFQQERVIESGEIDRFVAFFDIDDDNDLDFFANVEGAGFIWRENLGSFGFGNRIQLSEMKIDSFASVLFFDGDADGRTDVVVNQDDRPNSSRVFSQHIDKSFVETTTPGFRLRPELMIDIDWDGDVDYLNVFDNPRNIWNRTPSGIVWHDSFDDETAIPLISHEWLRSGQMTDLDFDGHVDIVGLDLNKDLIWLRNGGINMGQHASQFERPIVLLRGMNDRYWELTDLDGDGVQEVFVRASRLIYKFDSSERVLKLQERLPRLSGPRHFADIDGDKDLDLISSRGAVFENIDGLTFADSGTPFFDFVGAPWYTSGDFDGDGDTDLVATFLDELFLFENQNGQLIHRQEIDSLGLDAPVWNREPQLQTTDIDLDGRADLIINRIVFLSKKDEFALERVALPIPGGTVSVMAVDLDGDGDQDIIGRERSALYWLENVGSGTMARHQYLTRNLDHYPQTIYGMGTTDIDGDGDFDVLLNSRLIDSMNRVEWYRNDLETGPLANDLNHDGRIDSRDMDHFCKPRNDTELVPLVPNDPNQDRDPYRASDVLYFVRNVLRTVYGDVNVDGRFDSGDLVSIFRSDTYETGNLALWSEGDLNCDGVFTTSDLVVAFRRGGYARTSIPRGTINEMVAAIEFQEKRDRADSNRPCSVA